MASFGNLYDYNTANGVVVPQTSDVLSNVQNAFKEIFGSDFSVDPSTPNGVLISAIAMMFVDVCGVNAQNANGMNLAQATGTWLDSLGKIFGVVRLDGETDYQYRNRISESASRGSGFAQSIRNQLSHLNGVRSIVVLDNGCEDPSTLPKDRFGKTTSHSIAVPAHSIFVCVRGGLDSAVGRIIALNKSLGCAYTSTTEYGTPVVYEGEDEKDSITETPYHSVFYRPTQVFLSVSVTVNGAGYTGTDIVSDTKNAIVSILNEKSYCDTMTKDELYAKIASAGKGIVATGSTIKVGASAETQSSWSEVGKLVVLPYQYITTGETDEEKASFLANNLTVVVE